METTMKAAVVREFGKPLVIEDVAVPRPGPGQAHRRPRRARHGGVRLGPGSRPAVAGRQAYARPEAGNAPAEDPGA